MSDWTGNWVAERMKGHTEVSDVVLLAMRHVELTRKKYHTVIVGTTAVERFDASALTSFLEVTPEVAFVVNVPQESYVTGSALRLSARHGIPVGGLGDLMRAVSLPDISEYVNKEVSFIERGLAQHTHVESYERLDDRRYLVKRHDLDELQVIFLNEYDLTADHVRTARSRYGVFTMLVITNPSGRATSSAGSAAAATGCRIYKWGDFMGALNRR